MDLGQKAQMPRAAVAMNAQASMSPFGGLGAPSNNLGSQLGGSANQFGEMANSFGSGFESIDKSNFAQSTQATPRVADGFTARSAAPTMMMGASQPKQTISQNTTPVMGTSFSVSGSSQPTQVFNNYQ